MIVNLVDTNIVFDIVYTERDRNTLAMKFYREFKNLELMISDTVKVECMKVIMKYSMEFARDFNNFLAIKNSRGKSWDKMNADSRTNFLSDFVKNTKTKNNYKVFHPFYENVMRKIKKVIIFIDSQKINKYLLELPSAIQDYFLESIKIMFSFVVPNTDSSEFLKNSKKFEFLLKDYFDEKETSDFKILINLIMLVKVGDSQNNKIDSVLFYSCDKGFIKNFNTISQDKTIIFKNNQDSDISKIKFLTIKEKLHDIADR